MDPLHTDDGGTIKGEPLTEALAVIDKSQVEEVSKLDQLYGTMTVSGEASAKLATDALAIIGSMQKGLKVGWKALVEPFKEKVKTVDAAYKPLLARLDLVEAHLKGEIIGWRRKAIEIQQAEQRRIEADNLKRRQEADEAARKEREAVAARTAAEARAIGMTDADAAELGSLTAADVPVAAPVVVAPPPPVPTKIHADIGGASVVKIIDREAIQRAVDAGVREIPGLNIYQVWQFEIIDSTKIPDQYRKDSLRRS
jgi:hypothetical protein